MAYIQRNPRYQRQTSLSEVGEAGQQKLYNAKVLVIGAGGLGCPALLYLAGAGVGILGIVDNDQVSLNNLHRQVLYSTDDIGLSKALRATDILAALNPEIEIRPYNELLTPQNTLSIISQFDIILDGTDNFSSRYMINDACVLLDKTLIYGAISKFEGQFAVFNCEINGKSKTNYRDIFPTPPGENEFLNCEQAGVIGILPGIIGTMMANEAIKLITEIGEPMLNKLMTYNSLTNQTYQLEIQPRRETQSLIPKDYATFQQTDYNWLCSSSLLNQIDAYSFDQMLNDPEVLFIDVRELNETPLINDFAHLKIPLSELKNGLPQIKPEKVVLFCQSGKRSLIAAAKFAEYYRHSKKIYSLTNGIMGWRDLRTT